MFINPQTVSIAVYPFPASRNAATVLTLISYFICPRVLDGIRLLV